jgi:hypothetical protein
MEAGGRTVGNRQMGKFILDLARMPLRPPRSRIHDSALTQEDHRARFYEHYRKEAEKYDRGFVKKYDEDLNTTLIFVSFVKCSGVHRLTWATGWSVLCDGLRIHH